MFQFHELYLLTILHDNVIHLAISNPLARLASLNAIILYILHHFLMLLQANPFFRYYSKLIRLVHLNQPLKLTHYAKIISHLVHYSNFKLINNHPFKMRTAYSHSNPMLVQDTLIILIHLALPYLSCQVMIYHPLYSYNKQNKCPFN